MKALLVLLLASPALAQTSVRVSEVSLVPAISGAAGTIGGAALPLPVLGAGALSPLSPSLSIARTPALAAPAAVAAQAAASALPIPVLPAAPVPVQAAERAAESFRPQATAMRALAVAAPVKTGDEARLDGLFEGSASRAGSGVAAPAGTTALAPLIKALPAFSPAKFRHPVKLYGKFQLRRKTREAAYWGSALSIVASGGLALQAAFNIVVQKLITKQSAKEISEGIDDIPAGSTRLADDAPETAVIREAIQALDRRVSGEIKPFGLTVVDYGDRSGFDAFAGVGRDGKPHYLISADYARAPDQKMAEVYAAVLAHEHAHAYKNDIAHLRGAGPGGWRALRAPAYAAAGLIAVKAVILASPLMALPYAGIASTFLLGPGLLWTAGLLAAFLGLSAAYAMLDAAVYRVIEYEADYFAAGHTNPDWVIRMLEHFEKNMTPEEIESGPFALHPSLAERIARLRAVFEKGRKP